MSQDIPRSALNVTVEDGSTFELIENSDSKDTRKKFRMVANSGQVISHSYWNQFAVDLDNLKVGKQRKPGLLNHDPARPVAFTTKIEVTEEGLVAEGYFLDNKDGREVQELLAAGFPMQASVYIPPKKIQRLSEGETAEVNGQTITGPGHIFRESSLREVTFCSLGADENTSVHALSEPITIQAETFSVSETEAVMPELEKEAEDIVDSVSDQTESTTGAFDQEPFKQSMSDSFNEGVETERKRILALLEAQSADQFSLSLDLIQSGVSKEEGIQALFSDLKERLEDRLNHKLSSTPEPVGPLDTEIPQDEESKFHADKNLVEEFGEFEVFQAYQRAVANGSVREKRNP